MRAYLAMLGTGALLCGALAAQSELEPPVRVLSGGEPIDVDIGHAAPYWYDFDGDGLPDLLVGQFGEGKLRIYRNVGTLKEPRFDGFEWFMAGGDVARVPTG
jgi:hypothetical protein